MKTLTTYTKGNLYKVRWNNGGPVPATMLGSWTSERAARDAINYYMSIRKEKAIDVRKRETKLQEELNAKGKSRA